MSLPLQLGRYALFAELASGGMATVYLGRLNAEGGFGRTVAIKRLHPHHAKEREFVAMFLDEARLAARIRHPNVAATLDIVTSDDELFLVMEYVEGEPLGALLRRTVERKQKVDAPIAVAIAIGLLSGLHAAHEATDEEGAPLGIIHRDVSPQNVIVGTDGVPRLVDFGVARAASRLSVTRDGQIKGKLPYMAPEQLSGVFSRQTDVYAAGVVLWELLACRRLYRADTEGELFTKVIEARTGPPSAYNPAIPPELDAVVLRALAKDPEARWPTAHAMAEALDQAIRPASAMRVGQWVTETAAEALEKRSALVALAETGSSPALGDVTTGSLASELLYPARRARRRWAGAGLVALAGVAALLVLQTREGARPVARVPPTDAAVTPTSAPVAPANEPRPTPSVSPPVPSASVVKRREGPPPSHRSAAPRPEDYDDLLDTR